MFREDGDVVQIDLVRVSEDVCLRQVWVRHLFTHHFGLRVFEGGVSAKEFTLFLVLVGVCHFIYLKFE